ncbi:hypothetical protein FUAX_55270 (plasmid) [Fulvitalea axinellae]|uniref:Uncharacterized protein n=1 Tax=Fulvitalea axinellae TaxID=1182444 RepID=A0AAU9DKQ0_9BACT|nr:hypothetical protein FUAX_55270 [Fulvitalea axinellae]
MDKIDIFRKINSGLKYKAIEDYIGVDIPINISKRGEAISEEIKSMLEEYLNVGIKTIRNNNIEGTISKYGLIDVTFVLKQNIGFEGNKGIRALRDNGWVDKGDGGNDDDAVLLGLLEDIIPEVDKGNTFVKVHARVQRDTSWLRSKTYLVRQSISTGKIEPLREDRIQIFRIEDMCFTNYSDLWLWKHFYL